MDLVETILSTGIEFYIQHDSKSIHKKEFLHKSKNKNETEIIHIHQYLTKYRFLIHDFLQNEKIKINKTIHTKLTLEEWISFDYLYIFYHESICIYLFGKNGIDYLFFEGLHKWTDLKEINLKKWIQHHKLFYDNVFLQKGILFSIHQCYITPIAKDSFINIFQFIQYKYYNVDQNDKIPLIMEGYSLGGIYLQLWIQYMKKSNILKYFDIEAYQIESWFQGNEEEYKEFKKIISIKNMMKHGSYFHLYNSLFQKYRKIDYYIPRSEEIKDILYSNSPLRVIEYGIVSHLL